MESTSFLFFEDAGVVFFVLGGEFTLWVGKYGDERGVSIVFSFVEAVDLVVRVVSLAMA